MSDEKEHKEEEKREETKKSSFLKELISGSMITDKLILNNLAYILFITFLCAIYIGNRFHAEKITRDTTKLRKETLDLRAQSLSTSAKLMHSSRQSEVYRLVKEKGLELEELKVPPYKLVIDK